MSALWALIAIGYVNGQPADVQIAPEPDQATCKQNAEKSLEMVQPKLSGKFQVVFKCTDIGNMPITLSGFGTKKDNSTTL